MLVCVESRTVRGFFKCVEEELLILEVVMVLWVEKEIKALIGSRFVTMFSY